MIVTVVFEAHEPPVSGFVWFGLVLCVRERLELVSGISAVFVWLQGAKVVEVISMTPPASSNDPAVEMRGVKGDALVDGRQLCSDFDHLQVFWSLHVDRLCFGSIFEGLYVSQL